MRAWIAPPFRTAETQESGVADSVVAMIRNSTHATSTLPARGVAPLRWSSTNPGVMRLELRDHAFVEPLRNTPEGESTVGS